MTKHSSLVAGGGSAFHRMRWTMAAALAALMFLGPVAALGQGAPAAPAAPAAPLPRLLVITTGGTIGLNGQELVDAVPQLATIADIKVESFVSFGSSSMRPEHWVGLSRRINQAFQEDRGLRGVILTHGTDTM